MNDNKDLINKNIQYFYKINKVTDLYLNDINILDLLKKMTIK